MRNASFGFSIFTHMLFSGLLFNGLYLAAIGFHEGYYRRALKKSFINRAPSSANTPVVNWVLG